ncbi:MAG: SH3 domain-containing protein [Spirochaetes bacterium]|nr:SH3 domain-containing protein [Spirochaetota bacterium]
MWAFSGKQDPPPLPIREEAKQDAKTVYKLKPNQMVKVVSRSAEKETIKPYADYWYEVVTEDGFGGFVFGHFLKIFSVQGDPAAEASRLMSQDETLDRLLGSTWRPDYFREMVAKGMIDLSVFREDVGLFPSPSENIMRLQLPLSTFEFPYTGIEKLGASSYVFTGTDLRITVLDEERITINYRIKDQPVSGLYADLYAQLTKPGATLASSSYGTIHLGQDMRFSWQGFDKLVPSVIGDKAKGGGRVDFSLHLAKELAGAYDGVITFLFDEYADAQGAGPEAGVNFLYKAVGGGLRLTALARDSVKELIVTGTGISPVVVFFSQSEQ